VPHHEVPEVGNPEGELITAPAILGPRVHPSVSPHEPAHRFLLRLHFPAGPLIDQCAGDHGGGLKAAESRDHEALELPPEGGSANGPGLQGLAQLELEVVHQADAGRHRAITG